MSDPTVPVAAPLSPEERSRLQRLAEEAAAADARVKALDAADAAGHITSGYTRAVDAANDAVRHFRRACSPTVVLSLLAERDALARDAERYRFLRPHLDTDGDVDDADMACRFYAWIRIREEIIHVPDAIGYSSVDAAIDAALAARSGATPTGGETR